MTEFERIRARLELLESQIQSIKTLVERPASALAAKIRTILGIRKKGAAIKNPRTTLDPRDRRAIYAQNLAQARAARVAKATAKKRGKKSKRAKKI